MAIGQLPILEPGYDFGSELGRNLGTGLSQGLQLLAENKLKSLAADTERKRYASGLQQLPGMDQNISNFIANLNPEERKYALQNLGSLMQLSQLGVQPGGMQALPGMGQDQGQLGAIGQEGAVPGQAGLSQQQQLIQDIFKSPQQKQQEQLLELKKRSAESKEEQNRFQRQQTLKPFLDKNAEQFTAERRASKYAKQMLANLKKNQKKWPGLIRSLKPEQLERDPDVRKYMADANALVIALAQTRKGVPSNYKIKLEQLAKANLTQPIGTQMGILEDIVKGYNEEKSRQKYIDSLKDEKSGDYPLDLQRRVVDYDIKQDIKESESETFDRLPDPSQYAGRNVIATNPSTGQRMQIVNGQWVPIQGGM